MQGTHPVSGELASRGVCVCKAVGAPQIPHTSSHTAATPLATSAPINSGIQPCLALLHQRLNASPPSFPPVPPHLLHGLLQHRGQHCVVEPPLPPHLRNHTRIRGLQQGRRAHGQGLGEHTAGRAGDAAAAVHQLPTTGTAHWCACDARAVCCVTAWVYGRLLCRGTRQHPPWQGVACDTMLSLQDQR